ncbi:hypothetical protein ACQ4WX_38330 [Streptomyces lasalocidi]
MPRYRTPAASVSKVRSNGPGPSAARISYDSCTSARPDGVRSPGPTVLARSALRSQAVEPVRSAAPVF